MPYNSKYTRRYYKDRKDSIMTIVEFQGEYRFLSNFWFIPIRFTEEYEQDGLVYPTLEHAYQAAKTTSVNERRVIVNIAKPGDAKRAGRQLTMRRDWDSIKRQIMLDLLRYKFSDVTPYHLDLQNKLIATKDQELIEGNMWHDNYWGHCNCTRCEGIEGHNWLGRLLMHVRFEIQL